MLLHRILTGITEKYKCSYLRKSKSFGHSRFLAVRARDLPLLSWNVSQLVALIDDGAVEGLGALFAAV